MKKPFTKSEFEILDSKKEIRCIVLA